MDRPEDVCEKVVGHAFKTGYRHVSFKFRKCLGGFLGYELENEEQRTEDEACVHVSLL